MKTQLSPRLQAMRGLGMGQRFVALTTRPLTRTAQSGPPRASPQRSPLRRFPRRLTLLTGAHQMLPPQSHRLLIPTHPYFARNRLTYPSSTVPSPHGHYRAVVGYRPLYTLDEMQCVPERALRTRGGEWDLHARSRELEGRSGRVVSTENPRVKEASETGIIPVGFQA